FPSAGAVSDRRPVPDRSSAAPVRSSWALVHRPLWQLLRLPVLRPRSPRRRAEHSRLRFRATDLALAPYASARTAAPIPAPWARWSPLAALTWLAPYAACSYCPLSAPPLCRLPARRAWASPRLGAGGCDSGGRSRLRTPGPS